MEPHGIVFTSLFITSLLAALFAATIRSRRQATKNPPGPKGLPLIGNLLDFPQHRHYLTFTNWKKQYGNLVYLEVMGTPTLVLNSIETCADLLDKRSAKYSGRGHSIVLNDFTGFDYSFSLMDYNPRWRRYRRLFHQHFNEHISLTYRPTQERCIHHFLQRLLTKPEDFLDHIRLLFGETIMDVVYGIKVEDKHNIFIQAAEKAMEVAVEGTRPGRFLVEFFPALKYLPSWFPGGSFKKFAAEQKPAVMAAKDLPFDFVKNSMELGSARPSVLSSMLSHYNDVNATKDVNEAHEEVAKGCAAVAYLGGADTTLAAVQSFFMAMANYQDVQRAARAELAAILGNQPNRLPTHEDEAQLPFIVAITKELLRWHNVIPWGFAHVVTEDDEYNGYLIRKGTVVLQNVWGFLHDPEVYPDPFTFNPRRWLIDTPEGFEINPAVPDPHAAFGFGRRICPGRYFALNSLFITVAAVLACFDIQPLDMHGHPTNRVDEAFTDGPISYPLPYKVSITPHSAHLAQLIRDTM